MTETVYNPMLILLFFFPVRPLPPHCLFQRITKKSFLYLPHLFFLLRLPFLFYDVLPLFTDLLFLHPSISEIFILSLLLFQYDVFCLVYLFISLFFSQSLSFSPYTFISFSFSQPCSLYDKIIKFVLPF